MLYFLCAAVLVSSAVAVPMIEMTQARHLQTEIDKENMPIEHIFKSFKQLHKKVYESDFEENVRQGIFKANVEYIKAHNEKYAKGEKSYYLGVNQFADLTHKEFLAMYTGHLTRSRPSNGSTYLSPYNVELPETVDWRTKGLVTPVKDQKQCGSCWSFSATGSLEGQHFKKTGKLLSLSEQQLVDCSGSYGNQGCNGGLMDQAFEYIKSVKGLETEEDYPYLAEIEDKCKAKPSLEQAKVTGFVDVSAGDEKKLQEAVANIGPISIAIDASHPSFQMYKAGVYDEPECSSSQLDHGVLVVGYGTDSDTGKDYWLVKNSWNTVWGMEGYIMMSRNNDNQCGVASSASYPLV